MVTTIVEINDRIKESIKRWCDVLKQNFKNGYQIREEENRKNNVIVTGVSEYDDKTTIQPSNPSTQIRKKDRE